LLTIVSQLSRANLMGLTPQALFKAGETEEGCAAASAAMRLCPGAALNSSADAAALADWLSSAWDYLCALPHA